MNIFQKIINKEIKADIIFEDNDHIAFKDIKPERPGHFLVVPKNHSTNLYDITDHDLSALILKARQWALQVTKQMNVQGFNLKINNGKEAGQEVFHTHVHIIPSSKKS